MLVLTRKLNERIVIGENIRITVVGIRGNHVRLGIEAPPEVTILRDELRRHEAPAGGHAPETHADDPEADAALKPLAAAAGFCH